MAGGAEVVNVVANEAVLPCHNFHAYFCHELDLFLLRLEYQLKKRNTDTTIVALLLEHVRAEIKFLEPEMEGVDEPDKRSSDIFKGFVCNKLPQLKQENFSQLVLDAYNANLQMSPGRETRKRDQIADAKQSIQRDIIIDNMIDISVLLNQYLNDYTAKNQKANKLTMVNKFQDKLMDLCNNLEKGADVKKVKMDLYGLLDELQRQEDAFYQRTPATSHFSFFANTMKKWNSSLQPKINAAREIVAELDTRQPTLRARFKYDAI